MTTLTLTRGDTGKWTVPVTDSAGAEIDVTGCAFRMAFYSGTVAPAASATTDSSAALVLSSPSSGIALTTPASGILTVTMSKAQSAALTAEVYSFDLQMTNATSEEYTCASGILLLSDQVTHST